MIGANSAGGCRSSGEETPRHLQASRRRRETSNHDQPLPTRPATTEHKLSSMKVSESEGYSLGFTYGTEINSAYAETQAVAVQRWE